VMDTFRHDLGAASQPKTPELIHREFIDGVQGRVQSDLPTGALDFSSLIR
jgi:hypothetical protein